MTDVGRLARLVERAQQAMVHVRLERVSPMAVPVLVIVGQVRTPGAAADDAILIEAESLAALAMRID